MATTTVPLQISPGKPPAPWPLSPPVLSILNSATRGRQRTKGGAKLSMAGNLWLHSPSRGCWDWGQSSHGRLEEGRKQGDPPMGV